MSGSSVGGVDCIINHNPFCDMVESVVTGQPLLPRALVSKGINNVATCKGCLDPSLSDY
jgi:hypothetical protein